MQHIHNLSTIIKITIITVLHIVGLAGFYGWLPWGGFELLTPWHLLICFALLLSHQRPRKISLLFSVMIFLWGFAIEWLGVHTGLIFGQYSYGKTLGFKIDGVPLLIGINWIMLVYSSSAVAEMLPVTISIKIGIASLLMVFYDYLMEPFAMHYDLWQWKSGYVPIRNYIGWWLNGLLMQLVLFRLNINKKNVVAAWLWLIQIAFFAALLPLISRTKTENITFF